MKLKKNLKNIEIIEKDLLSIFKRNKIEKIIAINKKFDPKKNIQEIDFNLQLPWEFLYITDRLSMLNSIEARTPFLDDQMINYIKNVPSKKFSNKIKLSSI